MFGFEGVIWLLAVFVDGPGVEYLAKGTKFRLGGVPVPTARAADGVLDDWDSEGLEVSAFLALAPLLLDF